MQGKHDEFPVAQSVPHPSMLALNASVPGPHLEARDFRSLWTTGFPESRWRHRVLDHLVRGCEVCLGGLRGPVRDLPEEPVVLGQRRLEPLTGLDKAFHRINGVVEHRLLICVEGNLDDFLDPAGADHNRHADI